MEQPWTPWTGLLLVLVSAWAVYRHWRHRPTPLPDERAWFSDTTSGLSVPEQPPRLATPSLQEQADYDFRQRQFRRRVQTSLLVGAVGLLLPLAGWIVDPTWNVLYGVALLSLVGWMAMLGVADLVATRHHFNRVREQMLSDMMTAVRDEPENQKAGGHSP